MRITQEAALLQLYEWFMFDAIWLLRSKRGRVLGKKITILLIYRIYWLIFVYSTNRAMQTQRLWFYRLEGVQSNSSHLASETQISAWNERGSQELVSWDMQPSQKYTADCKPLVPVCLQASISIKHQPQLTSDRTWRSSVKFVLGRNSCRNKNAKINLCNIFCYVVKTSFHHVTYSACCNDKVIFKA